MSTTGDKPVLDYAVPSKRSRFAKLLSRLGTWMSMGTALFVAAIVLPLPTGIWYFGDRPKFLVAIDHAGLTVGSSNDLISLGWFPLVAVKLIACGLPLWLIQRIGRRLRWGSK